MTQALTLAERAPFYDFAARLLVSEVDASLHEALGRAPLRGMLSQLTPGFEAWIDAGFTTARRDALAEEFARLFLVPGDVPPYASHWLAEPADRARARTDIASLIANACDGLGYDPDDDGPSGRLPRDHAALVFALAARAGALPDAETDPLAVHFASELLGEGWAAFGDRLAQSARSPIYVALGVLLRDLHAPERSPTHES